MALRAMGVVQVFENPLLVSLSQDLSNHPAAACGCCFPSLSKEGSLISQFRDRN